MRSPKYRAIKAIFLFALTIAPSIVFAQAPGGVSNNLQFWVKADKGIASTTDGSPIEIWEDQSGNSRTATTPDINNPTFVIGAMNFNPAVNFSNNQDNFQVDDLNVNPNILNPIYTFIIYEQDLSSQALIGNDNGSYDFLIGTNEVGDNDVAPGFDISAYADIVGRPMFLQSRHVLNTADGSEVFVNGESAGTFTYVETDAGRAYTMIGDIYDGAADTSNMDGRIAEVIVYGGGNLLSVESQKINSYLALKYGISLNQSNPTDYLSSTGSIIWDSSEQGAYTNDIFGIGRDDGSGLDQRVSKAVGTSTVVTIALDDDFIAGNSDSGRSITHTNDLQFFIIADNNGATSTQSTEIATSSYSERIVREWKVNKTNFTQTLNIKFEGFDEEWTLLSDTNGDFSDGIQTEIGTLDENGEVSGDIPNGAFLTLAKKVVDVTSPVLTEENAVTTPTTDTTPKYSFTSTEAGSIRYGGDCTSDTTVAVAGSNTVEFAALQSGTYSNCTITVTDAAMNTSSVLAVTAFTIENAPRRGSSAPRISLREGNEAEDKDMELADLQKQLAQLQQKLFALKRENIPNNVSSSGCVFSRNLTKGMQGEDVRCLQKSLNTLGFTLATEGVGSTGVETVYFGPLTFDAIKRFQMKNAPRVLAPLGLQSATGYFGPQTRQALTADISLHFKAL